MIDVTKLKVGDKVRRIRSGWGHAFTPGKEYEIFATSGGSLFLKEDDGNIYDEGLLKVNSEIWEHVEEATEESTKASYFLIGSVDQFSLDDAIEVTIRTDSAGLREIERLRNKVSAEKKERHIDAKIANLERQIAELKEEKEKIK